jgi:hypothetical protein
MTAPALSPLLTEREAAAQLGVSFWTLRAWVCSGALPAVRLPNPTNPRVELRRRLIDARDLAAFIDAHRQPAAVSGPALVARRRR